MKVALINPRLKTWDLEVHVPLGITYIAAALENVGHDVKIIDLNARKLSDKQLINELGDSEVIGITGMVVVYQEIVRLCHVIKSHYEIPIILGGPLATTRTERLLNESGADYAVIGEGEISTVELLKALEHSNNPLLVKGIAYQRKGKVGFTSPREQIDDIDLVSFPARHLLDFERYSTDHFREYGKECKKLKTVAMFSSRGCMYKCIFCFHEVWGHKWRGRSADNIIREMMELNSDYGYNGFLFYDDTFVVNRKRVVEFCEKLIASKKDFIWGCNGRLNLMDEELIKLMYKAGCRSIGYGIEAGNPEILKFIQKAITLEQAEKVCKWTEDAGIKVTGLFMIGMLGETKQTIQETIDVARKLNCTFNCFAITVPMYGTELYRQALKQGLVSSEDIEGFRAYATTNLTKDCTREDLERFSKEAYREFTLEKKYGKRYLMNPLMWNDGLRSFVGMVKRGSATELIKRGMEIVRK